ncbi:24759_t:CDS:2 [Cetraspora pellucida]|uniref:24759_t:CDS:1 n=1 Tax=Cetraspora pellucida TaxID=1433469 RepID=A0A9N9J8D1_9GLOM|nr:24759_t:CDS:2 [Cetraspora pellucida]
MRVSIFIETKEIRLIVRIKELEQSQTKTDKLIVRITELEYAKEKNIKLKAEVAKLRHDFEKIKLQIQVITNKKDIPSTDISHSLANKTTITSNSLSISSEDKKIDEFIDSKYKEKVNLSCDIKTISQENDYDIIEGEIKITFQVNNQQKTILSSLPVKDFDDSDEIELTKNQNIELDLI